MKLSKNLGRIATTFLATAMLAAFAAVPASAEAVTEPAEGENSISSIKINAELMMPEGVLTPNVTFNFNIESAGDVEKDDTITSNGTVIALENGIGSNSNAGAATFSNSDGVGVASGTEGINKVTKTDVELSLTGLGGFTDAGVYKYYITEDTPTSSDEDFSDSDYVSNLKLPLYIFVERDTDGSYIITGAVVYKSNSTADGQEGSKTDTFVNWYQIDNPENPQVKTGNLSIANDVSGAMGDRGEAFDFTIGNLTDGAKYSVKYSDTDDYVPYTVSNNVLTLSVKHGQTVTVYGLDANAYTVTAPDMTSEGYTLDKVTVGGNNQNKEYVQNVTVSANSTAAVKYFFSREAITPTGLVMNVAPYVLLVLVAAGAGYVFLRKREED